MNDSRSGIRDQVRDLRFEIPNPKIEESTFIN